MKEKRKGGRDGSNRNGRGRSCRQRKKTRSGRARHAEEFSRNENFLLPRNEFFPVDGARSPSCLLPSLETTALRQTHTHDAKYKMDNKQNNNPRALGLKNCDSSLTVNKMAVNKTIERGRLKKKKMKLANQMDLTLSDSHGGHLNPHGGRFETIDNSIQKNQATASKWIGLIAPMIRINDPRR